MKEILLWVAAGNKSGSQSSNAMQMECFCGTWSWSTTKRSLTFYTNLESTKSQSPFDTENTGLIQTSITLYSLATLTGTSMVGLRISHIEWSHRRISSMWKTSKRATAWIRPRPTVRQGHLSAWRAMSTLTCCPWIAWQPSWMSHARFLLSFASFNKDQCTSRWFMSHWSRQKNRRLLLTFKRRSTHFQQSPRASLTIRRSSKSSKTMLLV